MRIIGQNITVQSQDKLDPAVSQSMATLIISDGPAKDVSLAFFQREELCRLIEVLVTMDREWHEGMEFAAEPIEVIRD